MCVCVPLDGPRYLTLIRQVSGTQYFPLNLWQTQHRHQTCHVPRKQEKNSNDPSEDKYPLVGLQGPNSIGKFCLEKPLEFWLDISIHQENVQKWVFTCRRVAEPKWTLNLFFKPKLKSNVFPIESPSCSPGTLQVTSEQIKLSTKPMFASQFVEPKKTLSAKIMHGMKSRTLRRIPIQTSLLYTMRKRA